MFGECQKGSAAHCPSASPCCAWCCQRDQRRALPRGVYNPVVTTPLSRSPPRQESCSSSAGGHLTSSQPAVGLFRLPARDPAHKALPVHTGMISKTTCLDMSLEGDHCRWAAAREMWLVLSLRHRLAPWLWAAASQTRHILLFCHWHNRVGDCQRRGSVDGATPSALI